MNMSFSARTLLISFITVGLSLILIANFSLYIQGKNIQKHVSEQAFLEAKKELENAIEISLDNIHKELDALAVWDDVHQQLHNPSFYYYWHQQRLMQSSNFKPYYQQLKLYNKQRHPLTLINDHKTETLPDSVASDNHVISLPFINQEYYIAYKPVYDRAQPEELLGYVGISVDFYKVLQHFNQFYYLDFNEVFFNRSGVISETDIMDAINFRAKSNPVSDELWSLIEEFVKIFTLIILIASVSVLIFVHNIFLKPLNKIHRYLEQLRKQPHDPATENQPNILLKEFQNLKDQIKNYHNALLSSKTELEQRNQQLNELTRTDSTTGVGNKRALVHYWQECVDMHSIKPQALAYMMLDCIKFRLIVEECGYQKSEELVQEWVKRLKEFDDNLMIFRIGSNKLALIAFNLTTVNVESYAEQLLNTLENPKYDTLDTPQPVEFYLGVSFMPDYQSTTTMNDLPKKAEFALYRARNADLNKIQYY